ncbi:hypothetical protein ACTFIR_012156 [Dictyostelium discoideum]
MDKGQPRPQLTQSTIITFTNNINKHNNKKESLKVMAYIQLLYQISEIAKFKSNASNTDKEMKDESNQDNADDDSGRLNQLHLRIIKTDTLKNFKLQLPPPPPPQSKKAPKQDTNAKENENQDYEFIKDDEKFDRD